MMPLVSNFAVEKLFNDEADQCLLAKEAMKYYANILKPLFSPGSP